MKRSFKLHFFIQILITTLFVIFANRLIAQHYLLLQMTEKVHQEMGIALSTCESKFSNHDDFLQCFKSIEKGSLTNSISDFYVFCDSSKNAVIATDQHCEQARLNSNFWSQRRSFSELESNINIDYAYGLNAAQEWVSVRFAANPDGPQIWLRQSEVHDMLWRMWALRDRNLARTLPSVVCLLLFLTLYMTYVVMRSISSLENTLSKMTPENLNESVAQSSPFKEFDKVVNVFEGLRVRLHESFVKARRFAADASHELRTPLTILRGNVERLIHELPVGSETQIRMRNLGDEVERLIEITEKLLLLSRADANSLQRQLTNVDISERLSQLLKDARGFHPNLRFTSEIEPSIFWHCDNTLANQLIHNLYANAVNYNQPNGWVHIKLQARHKGFVLSMENPTESIPTELSIRAFERFYRGDESHGRQVDGLGLGLSICAEIAKAHGAQIDINVTEKGAVLVTLIAG
jgi:signal transduction histidine kinase